MSAKIGELMFLQQLAGRFKIPAPDFVVEPVNQSDVKKKLQSWGAGIVKPDVLAGKRGKAGAKTSRGKTKPPPVPLDAEGLIRFAALKAWRAGVAREHNLPAYVVFNDATLAEMAQEAPDTLDDLSDISGVGAKKLEAYGREILRVLGGG